MTTFDACVAQLDALIEMENAALSRMDMESVAALTAEKNRLVDLLRGYSLDKHGRPNLSPDTGAMRDLSRAADKNKVLLERAMRVQRRLMAMVASAGRPQVSSYGRNGVASGGNVQPRAIMARV